MDKETLEELKQKLENEKRKLEGELGNFAEKNPKNKDDWKVKFPKYGEEAHIDETESQEEVEEYLNLLPVEEHLEIRLRDINAALEKIKTGVYGICEEDKHEIEITRLKVNPEARFCLKHSK